MFSPPYLTTSSLEKAGEWRRRLRFESYSPTPTKKSAPAGVHPLELLPESPEQKGPIVGRDIGSLERKIGLDIEDLVPAFSSCLDGWQFLSHDIFR